MLFRSLFRNDIPIDITGAQIDVWYRVTNEVGKVVKKFTIGNGITIQDLLLGKIEIDAFICDLPIGFIVADVKVTFPTNDPQIFRKFGFHVKRTITE